MYSSSRSLLLGIFPGAWSDEGRITISSKGSSDATPGPRVLSWTLLGGRSADFFGPL